MELYLASMDTAFGQYKYPLLPTGKYFVSYFYKNNTEKVLAARDSNFKGKLFCDSGAHSFFGAYGLYGNVNYKQDESKRIPLEKIKAYFEEYFLWVQKWYHKLDYFAELDLQEIVGLPLVMQWRKRFIQAGMGKKMVMVVHTGDTWEDFLWMLNNSPSNYVATQGMRADAPNIDHMMYVKECYKRGIKVHGFAMTKKKVMESIPFYSVDSSSWTSCWKFGTVFKYHKGNICRIQNSPSSLKRLLKFGIPTSVIGANGAREQVKAKALISEIEWRKYEKFIGELWNSRGINWERKVKS